MLREACGGAGVHHHFPRNALSPECGDGPSGGENHSGKRRGARYHCHHRRPPEGGPYAGGDRVLREKGQAIAKASRRDLAVLCAQGQDGATTVTTTMIIAHMAGISMFATGGIGGVHRGAETTMDISADLEELARTPVMVVCAGAKSILDLGLTLEYLETHGVPVIGYGTEELPAFYTRTSGFPVDYRVDTPEELAAAFRAQNDMALGGGNAGDQPHSRGVFHGPGCDQRGH